MTDIIKVVSANIHGASTSSRLHYGILQTVENINASASKPVDIALCQETWHHKDPFKISNCDNFIT